MKAVVFEEHGPPEVLRVREVEVPEPGAGEIRVRVRASGVQPFDTGVRQGWPGFPVTFPARIGNEFAGTVDQVGPGVSAFAPGDEVLGWVYMAALAEYLVVSADNAVAKPAGMPWEVAGAFSASGQSAYTALAELGVGAGDTVLVHAAAGGVGTVAVQLARHWGATVIGTASEPNHDYLRELGATPVAYGDGMVERVQAVSPRGVDAVIDGAGGQALLDSVRLVDQPDRIVTLVDHDIAKELGARGVSAQRSAARLAELVGLYEAGHLRVHVRSVYGLADVVQAHHEVERGHGRGKVVVALP